jgi:hypothetical protein
VGLSSSDISIFARSFGHTSLPVPVLVSGSGVFLFIFLPPPNTAGRSPKADNQRQGRRAIGRSRHRLSYLPCRNLLGFQPGLGYALPMRPCLYTCCTSNLSKARYFQAFAPNYAIKPTSVGILCQSFTSGASAPYFGC